LFLFISALLNSTTRLQLRLLFDYRLILHHRAQRVSQDERSRRGALSEIVMSPERQRTQPRHLPQQRSNIGRVGAALLNGSQVILGERGLEAHGGITVHPYSVPAV